MVGSLIQGCGMDSPLCRPGPGRQLRAARYPTADAIDRRRGSGADRAGGLTGKVDIVVTLLRKKVPPRRADVKTKQPTSVGIRSVSHGLDQRRAMPKTGMMSACMQFRGYSENSGQSADSLWVARGCRIHPMYLV
jgi:hypothetical protein